MRVQTPLRLKIEALRRFYFETRKFPTWTDCLGSIYDEMGHPRLQNKRSVEVRLASWRKEIERAVNASPRARFLAMKAGFEISMEEEVTKDNGTVQKAETESQTATLGEPEPHPKRF
jgi:hypothetical protein